MEVYKLLLFFSIVSLSEAIVCFKCNGGTLDQCKTSSKCKGFHNRCLSLLLEGGEHDEKIYYKGCGTSGTCNTAGYKKKCAQKNFIFRTGSCRASCCTTDECNHSNRHYISWAIMGAASAVAMKIIG